MNEHWLRPEELAARRSEMDRRLTGMNSGDVLDQMRRIMPEEELVRDTSSDREIFDAMGAKTERLMGLIEGMRQYRNEGFGKGILLEQKDTKERKLIGCVLPAVSKTDTQLAQYVCIVQGSLGDSIFVGAYDNSQAYDTFLATNSNFIIHDADSRTFEKGLDKEDIIDVKKGFQRKGLHLIASLEPDDISNDDTIDFIDEAVQKALDLIDKSRSYRTEAAVQEIYNYYDRISDDPETNL